jgi:prophage regulatory protein
MSQATNHTTMQDTGFLREWDIIPNKKRQTKGLIPIGRTSWYAGIKSGKYPAPVKLTERISAWKAEDIAKLIQELGGNADAG